MFSFSGGVSENFSSSPLCEGEWESAVANIPREGGAGLIINARGERFIRPDQVQISE